MTQTPCPRPIGQLDAAVLIGWTAVVEGESLRGFPDTLRRKLRERLIDVGLLEEEASDREFRQAVNDLNHRLRYALGEYSEPPKSLPVPE